MRHHFARLGRQTAVYGLSGVAQQFLGVITVPVMAHVFSTAQYGVLNLITTAIAAVAIFVDLGLASASQRSFYDYSDAQPDERRLVLSTALVTSFAAAFAVAAAVILLREPLAQFLFGGHRYANLLIIAAATLPLTALMSFSREIMRLHFRAWHFFASSMLAAVAGTTFIVVSLTVLHIGLRGVLFSGAGAAGLAGVYGMIIVRHDVGRGISRRELGKMFNYGLPLVPTAAALWALALIDRIMLGHLAAHRSALSEIGEYAMANQVVLLIAVATTAFATAFSPFMLSLFAEDPEEEKRVRATVLTLMSIVFALLAVCLSLYAREVLQVVAPRFHTAYEAVGLLSAGGALNGVALIALGGISLARTTRRLIAFTGAAAALNIGVNLIVIPPWGMVGAAFATAIAYLLLLGLYYTSAQRVYPTPYHLARVLRVTLLAAPAIAVGAIPIEPLELSLVVKTATLAGFLIGVWALRVVRTSEVSALWGMVRGRSRPTAA
jgi:O-antigen/teichoic acid export membrane protein